MDISLPGIKCIRGKVRNNFDLINRHRLIVATDRLSAFDVVMADPIPHKGMVLTQLSAFWFEKIKESFPWLPTHFITADWQEIIELHPEIKDAGEDLDGRSMLVHHAQRVLPVEAIVRGYLYGSGWKDYLKSGEVCGIKLPAGMKMADLMPFTAFTPSTKAEQGEHDQNIRPEDMQLGANEKQVVTAISILLYTWANAFAQARGIIIADTKFEFGTFPDGIYLIDEVLTPDSSRFWPKDQYQPGDEQPSFDKQFVRDYLEKLVQAGQWDKKSPAPRLPQEIIDGTSRRYLQALEILTGKGLDKDTPFCNVCGGITVRMGTCYKCLFCGNSMSCS